MTEAKLRRAANIPFSILLGAGGVNRNSCTPCPEASALVPVRTSPSGALTAEKLAREAGREGEKPTDGRKERKNIQRVWQQRLEGRGLGFILGFSL